MKMTDKIEITKEEYFGLRTRSERLKRLENGGVDNWSWYGESIYGEDVQDWDEFEEELRKEIWPEKF
jgi:hypothetical protein